MVYRLWSSAGTRLMWDIYLRFIHKCFSWLKYVNFHLPADGWLLFLPTTFNIYISLWHQNAAAGLAESRRSPLVLPRNASCHPASICGTVPPSPKLQPSPDGPPEMNELGQVMFFTVLLPPLKGPRWAERWNRWRAEPPFSIQGAISCRDSSQGKQGLIFELRGRSERSKLSRVTHIS